MEGRLLVRVGWDAVVIRGGISKPVRSHAGINVAGPPTCDSNAGGQHEKVKELGVIIREKRRVKREGATHVSMIRLAVVVVQQYHGNEGWGGGKGTP